jgi:sugar O-acyltransferase (sialic acid O-acetyltransferase NeuD family)
MNLIIYCAGGFGREILDIAYRINSVSKRWEDIKFLDDVLDSGTNVSGISTQKFTDIKRLYRDGDCEFVIANGEPSIRKMLADKIQDHPLAILCDPTVIISTNAKIGNGLVVAAYSSIASDAKIGKNVAINTQSVVGHDVEIGDHSVISSMVNMGGGTTVGESSYIGMGAQIKERVKIGSNSIIGMGSIVYKDIPDGVIALGNPARVVRKNEHRKIFE